MKTIAATLALVLFSASAWAQSCPEALAERRPTFAPPVDATIFSAFGERTSAQETRFHPGVDYAVAVGTPVHAAAGGTVVIASAQGDYGNYVRIRHGRGYETAYAHLSAFAVKVGDCVKAGDQLGQSGMNQSRPALHFELLVNGRFLDPSRYVADNRAKP